MLLSILSTTFALAAVAVNAAPFVIPRGCGALLSQAAQEAGEKTFGEINTFLDALSSPNATSLRLARPSWPIPSRAPSGPIPVYWHIVHSSNAVVDGALPDSQIQSTIATLNTDFAGTGFTWKLAGVDRTLNTDWFNNAGQGEAQQDVMKNALRKGGANALNVYSVGFNSPATNGTLGYSTFPSQYFENPLDDGVVMFHRAVTGGSLPNYNLGRTLTHEVGHWLGLYHPFQGGCASIGILGGDWVADTPPQYMPTFGCPTSQDSCPGGGQDSVNNFMDYAYDACMSKWTPGQIQRAKRHVRVFRGIYV